MASDTQTLLSKVPTLKKLVIKDQITLSPSEFSETEYLSSFSKTRVMGDLISSVSAHAFCTAKISPKTLLSLQKALATEKLISGSLNTAQSFSKNPTIGYYSTKKAMNDAVQIASNFVLFKMSSGAKIPDSVYASLERSSKIVDSYGVLLYFVDACATRSKRASSLAQVIKLTEYAINTAKKAAVPSRKIEPLKIYGGSSLSWIRLSSAIDFLKKNAPEHYPQINLESQFVTKKEYDKLESKCYKLVLSSVEKSCSGFFSEKIEGLRSAIKERDFEKFRTLVEETENFCFGPEEHKKSEKFLFCRRFVCESSGMVENCRFTVSVFNPNNFASFQELTLYDGEFEDFQAQGYVDGNRIITQILLRPLEKREISGTLTRTVPN